MGKLNKPKYMKIFDIQKVLKYIFAGEKRPNYVQLIPKPHTVAVIHITQPGSRTSKEEEKGTLQPLLERKAIKKKEETNLTPFERELDAAGYLRMHINENMGSVEVFKNLLKSIDVKSISFSVITEENLKLIEKQDVRHMFSYTSFIKSRTSFDFSVFETYTKPKDENSYFLIAIDCEMLLCEGKDGPVCQVGRVSMLDHAGNSIYDKFIRPEATVIDYLEQYSGLNEENTRNGISLEELRSDLQAIIGTNTYLLGHGLENDLEALSFYTDKVIDTAYLFLTTDGYKLKLSQLSKVYFNEQIQKSKHCSAEDALCCLKLLAYKIAQLRNFFDSNGEALDLGVPVSYISAPESLEMRTGVYLLEQPEVDISKNGRRLYCMYLYEIENHPYLAFKQKI